jgi:hypothetical protein
VKLLRASGYFALLLALAFVAPLRAEPYLAVEQGLKCSACHVNPTGGGLRNEFGNTYAQTVLAARAIDVGDQPWTGRVSKYVQLGGNVRGGWSGADVEGEDFTNEFDVNEGRAYLNVEPIPGRLSVYVDEQLAPGNATNLETYVRYTTESKAWFVRVGKFFLPFGLRLEDDTAFTRQVPGLNMTTPDNGVEVGWEDEHWSAQLAISNGSGGGPESDEDKQFTGQFAYVDALWRLGAIANFNMSDAGDRTAYGVFGGLLTGPVAWLGEFDYVEDEGFTTGKRNLLAGLLEANWRIVQGHNAKFTAEWFDPDDDVDEDEQTRWSIVYEYSPIQFLQLRAGARIFDGIPQNALQNREEYFVELHGFF